MGPQGLAKRLKCDIPTARSCLDKFEKAYPNDMAYRRMIVSQTAPDWPGGNLHGVRPHRHGPPLGG